MVAAAAAMLPGAGRAGPYRSPRNVFGKPDLQGLWTNASYTQLERPPAFKSLVITPEAARKAEAIFARIGNFDPQRIDPLGQKDSETWEVGDGLARVRGEIRTSWIVDPPDGKLPFNDETKKRFHYDLAIPPPRDADNPEEQTVTTRCVASEGGYPPNLPSPDGNYLQIVQTADHVVLLSEKYNDAHIVRMGDAHHAPAAVTSWMGDAIGRWEGETLVIENANFCAQGLSRTDRLKLSPAAILVEKFTRLSPNELLYEFSVTDPTLYTQTWRAEMPFRKAKGPMYEYACHEGNYGLTRHPGQRAPPGGQDHRRRRQGELGAGCFLRLDDRRMGRVESLFGEGIARDQQGAAEMIAEIAVGRSRPPARQEAPLMVTDHHQVGLEFLGHRPDDRRGLADHQLGDGLVAARFQPGGGASQQVLVGVDLLGDGAAVDPFRKAGSRGVRHDGQEDDLRAALSGQQCAFAKRQRALGSAVVGQQDPLIHSNPL